MRNDTRPISFSSSDVALSSRRRPFMSRRYCSDSTVARTVRVECFSRYERPTASDERSSIQHTVASMSCELVGRLFGRHSTSPRDTAMSSSSVTTTAIGGKASRTSPSAVTIDSIRDVVPVGSTSTSSPGRSTPDATVPA